MSDLLNLGDTSRTNATYTLDIVHPDTKEPLVDDSGTKVTVEYVGFESDEAVAANHENRRVNYQRVAEGLEPSPDVEDAAFFRLLAYCTKGWTGIPKAWLHGPDADDAAEPLPFSRDNAFALYKRLSWLRGQVNTAMSKRRGFITASSGS